MIFMKFNEKGHMSQQDIQLLHLHSCPLGLLYKYAQRNCKSRRNHLTEPSVNKCIKCGTFLRQHPTVKECDAQWCQTTDESIHLSELFSSDEDSQCEHIFPPWMSTVAGIASLVRSSDCWWCRFCLQDLMGNASLTRAQTWLDQCSKLLFNFPWNLFKTWFSIDSNRWWLKSPGVVWVEWRNYPPNPYRVLPCLLRA